MQFSLKTLAEIWEEERPRFFLWSPVVLGLGIGAYFLWPTEPDFILSFLLTLFAASVAVWRRALLAPKVAALALLGFTVASLAAQVYGTPMLDWPLGAVSVSGTIRDIEQRESGRRLLLDDLTIEKLPVKRWPHRLYLTVSKRLDKQTGELRPGQRFEGLARLMPLSEPLAPNTFDFRRNGFFKGVGATGYAMGRIKISEPEGKSFDPGVWFAQSRKKIQAEVLNTLEGDRAGLAIILLTGDQSYLGAETAEAMRAIGLAHLLAIAGLHVGLIAGIVFFLTRLLLASSMTLALRFPIKKWAAMTALLAIILYTFQVGAPVPTRRAVVMAGLVLIGIMLDRVTLSQRSIAVAALVVLFFWPQMLLHPAFQLSFAAVLGIISLGAWARERHVFAFVSREGWRGAIGHHVVELAASSVAATLATLPFCLYHFQEAEVYSVLANTLAIPLTSFWLMTVCVFVYLLWPFGLAAWPLGMLDSGLGLLIGLSHKIAALPGAHYAPPPMPLSLLVVATFGGLAGCLMRGRRRWLGFAAMMAAIVVGFWAPRPDILVSPDGQQVGWRRADAPELLVAVLDEKDKFAAKYWGNLVGVNEEGVRFVSMEQAGPVDCDEKRCLAQYPSGAVSFVRNAEGLRDSCAQGYAVIIYTDNATDCGETQSRLITRETLRARGAQALYVTPEGFEVRAARDGRALRPWSVGWRPSRQEEERVRSIPE